MTGVELVVAILAGIVQGVVEWLPVSSQGNVSLFLTAVGRDPEIALQLALFLQVGTTLSAAIYYRDDLETVVRTLPEWRARSPYSDDNALTTYVVVACLMTGIIGIPLYVIAVDLASELSGGVFITVVGVLLILTGLFELRSKSGSMGDRKQPTFVDSLLVGAAQGFAILPGISRSGITTSTLLFRSYDPPEAFRLSFLLSIPASIGGAMLTVVGAGGLPGIDPTAAVVALAVSAVVGYLTISLLMDLVDRIPFWGVCFFLGTVAIVGGGTVIVLL